jgi:hypothetical protein
MIWSSEMPFFTPMAPIGCWVSMEAQARVCDPPNTVEMLAG